MKKIFFAAVLFSFISKSFADEGMWLPLLIKSLNEKDMKKNGLKLSAEDIYSINKSSLKDAVVHFGGGCTAEIISESGLLLTNHHCGYGQIANHSTVEKDYLTNGFWAMNKDQELSNPGLTASIIQYMEDVTFKVKAGIKPGFTEKQIDSTVNANIPKIEKEAVKGTHYEAYIRPFFYGNEYYMFVVET
ncbi:MAG: S46 family peptidase, partial [Bacteroidota bacterium]